MKLELVDRVKFIVDSCRGKKVLHLGCTNWPYTQDAIDKNMLLHFTLRESAAELHGMDYDIEGIELLESHGVQDLFQGDLERLHEVADAQNYDLIVAGEMIEHLNNPGLFLNGIKRFMNRESELLITTINAYGASRFIQYGLRGKGGFAEPVHPDHVAYYSYSTLKLLIERAGLVIDKFCYYDIGPEHRPYNRKWANAFNDLCVKVAPQLADGVIAVCKLGPEVTAKANE